MADSVKLAILTDHPSWIQHQNALALQKYAPPWCHVDVLQLGHGSTAGYDAVYNMNLPSCGPGHVGSVASHAWMYPRLDPNDWRTRGVNPCRNSESGARHLSVLKAATCRNKALGEWASQHCQRVGVFPAGIDPEVYYPVTKPPRNLRVGWCGQVHEDDRNGQVKGYHEIWLPLVETFGNRYDFEANTNTAATALPQHEMAEWYRSLDVFLSTSCGDGTPNPPLNAAACGCAVVSTDVGQMSDWDALRECGMIVPTYKNTTEAYGVRLDLANKLAELEDVAWRHAVAESLLASIERDYNYRTLAPKTLEFVCGVTA